MGCIQLRTRSATGGTAGDSGPADAPLWWRANTEMWLGSICAPARAEPGWLLPPLGDRVMPAGSRNAVQQTRTSPTELLQP